MKALSKFFVSLCLLGCLLISASCETEKNPPSETAELNKASVKIAIFAGGCFWCMEGPFDKLDGVISTISGYTGGHTLNPNYESVSYTDTGHFEAMQVTYDPTKINYTTLLNVFWHNVDPLDANGQFCDKGASYRTAIFYADEAEKLLAEQSVAIINNASIFDTPVVTQLLHAKTFYPAEDYHQDYYQKNPLRYKYYRFACGRDQRLKSLWGSAATKGGSLIPD